MLFNTVVSVFLAAGLATTSPIQKRQPSFDFGSEKVRGVNIGGWLVLEPWITPSIFQAQQGVVDEYTLCQKVPNAGDILKQHWENWVSLDDFQTIANAGFNTVRIPVGYWAYQKFGNDPYIQGAAPYIDKAIGWANQTGLKVWIDLHGVPGSQNGYDNSGQLTKSPGWTQGDTVKQTLSVLQRIADKYAQPFYQSVVAAIELVNEPLPDKLAGGTDAVVQYSKDGYGEVRTVSSDMPVVVHDAFQNGTFWNNILASGADYVVIDHHEYQVFSDEEVGLSAAGHRQLVCSNAGTYSANVNHWVVVGEWSAAMTDCAAALNGYGIGSRYEGYYPGSTHHGSCSNINFIDTWDQTLKDNTRLYIETQLDVYERFTNGWIFWNFKTEASAEWDLFRLLNAGLFPQPLTSRQSQSICS